MDQKIQISVDLYMILDLGVHHALEEEVGHPEFVVMWLYSRALRRFLWLLLRGGSALPFLRGGRSSFSRGG